MEENKLIANFNVKVNWAKYLGMGLVELRE